MALLCVPGAVASAADTTPSDAVTLGCGAADIDWQQAAGSTINVLMITTQEAEAIKELVPAFEELTGITVNWDSLEQNSEIDKLNVEFRSGAGSIDAFQVDFMLLPEWAENGYLEPLDAYLSDPALTDAAWYDSGDFLGGIWGAGQWDGAQYLIPMSAESSLLIYRKDLLDATGLAVPTTFEELEVVAAALNDPPTVYGIGDRGLRGSGQNIYIWTSFLRGFGGDFFKDFPNDFTPTLDTPEAIAATQLYADLDVKYGPPGRRQLVEPGDVSGRQGRRHRHVHRRYPARPARGRSDDGHAREMGDRVGASRACGSIPGHLLAYARGQCRVRQQGGSLAVGTVHDGPRVRACARPQDRRPRPDELVRDRGVQGDPRRRRGRDLPAHRSGVHGSG